jgi:hypothetical protein
MEKIILVGIRIQIADTHIKLENFKIAGFQLKLEIVLVNGISVLVTSDENNVF